MFRRLSARITLLTVILLVVLYSISSFAVYEFSRTIVYRQLDQSLNAAMHHVLQTNRLDQTGVPDVFAISGQSVNSWAPRDSGDVLKSIDQTWTSPHLFNYSANGNHFRIYYLPVIAPGTQTYVVTYVEDSRQLGVLNQLKRVIFIVGIFGLAAAALVGFYLAERMLKPIRSAWRRQLEFVADASHELRTPLAVIQSNLGIVLEHTDETVTENLEWLNNAHSESRRLSKLVRDLLTLARSDSEKTPIERNPVDLRELILHIRELYETVAEMKGIRFTTHADVPLTISGDKDRLHQLLVILLDNALKFTDADGVVEIGLSQQRNSAVISVTDSGLGIARENLSRVFDRFFTVDPSRSREQSAKGTGLGLSIARWIVDAHGGKISLHSEGIGQGTTVRIELPIAARTTRG
ncbi:sensor histidine kinase [Alicyclobacillus dauci]|uniref:histidine kinase n=1 Tax=Alicyclobacillus dauci TaxID=1475485 RepID=A0ABY6Z5F9_9BACL|nr:HAMP domain-containing sensor histidine kinase [Alicyclobacillus dauci]WAH38100.1 HAMP domain-containing histidine kinase [Alicyclobacillus dauci]